MFGKDFQRKYALTDQGLKNGDVFMRGDGITMNDAATIQLYLLGKLDSLPADK